LPIPADFPLTRYLRIWLQCSALVPSQAQILYRVRAFVDFPDVAHDKPSQLSSHDKSSAPSYGNDGIMAQYLNKSYESVAASAALCATTLPTSTSVTVEDDVWWMVDLGRQKYNYVLMLYQLINPGLTQRVAQFDVYIGNTTTSYEDGTATLAYNSSTYHNMWTRAYYRVPLGGILGQYIWISIWGAQRILTVCEALISSCPPGCYPNDGYTPCMDINECLVNNGGCGTYQCINLDGGYMCRPVVDESTFRIDGRIPVVQDDQLMLESTAGGQLLSARLVWMGRTFPITIQYGSLGHVYTCIDASLTYVTSPATAPAYDITCKSAPGVGVNMSIWIEVMPFDETVAIIWPNGKLAYRYPSITAGTLELVPSAQSPSTYINIYDTKKSHKIAFDGAGFAADTERLHVYLGTDDAPYHYQCPLVISGDEKTIATRIVCSLPSGASGVYYHFHVVVSGSDLIFTGSDQVNFVTRSEIVNITGCVDELYGAATSNCPTEGNVTISLYGTNFVPPVTLMVGAYSCNNVVLRSSLLMTCILPPGIGSLLSITGTSGTLPIVSERVTLSYGGPTITLLSAPMCIVDPSSPISLLNCDRVGGTLQLDGVNFGTTPAAVLVGGQFCRVTLQTNNRITCTLLGGSGKFVAITIIQGGQVSNSGPMISYDDCPIGYVDNNQITSSCYACQPGSFAEVRGQPTCASCARGLYSNVSAATMCHRCHPGFITPTVGLTTCEACDIGSYVESEAQATCLPCWTGSQMPITGQSGCWNCDLGRYAPSMGMTECLDCDIGEYSDTIGDDYCKFCGRGRYGNTTGLTACYECDIGHYSAQHGMSSCDACSPRQFQQLLGQTFCYSCAVNEYLYNPESSKPCSPCPQEGALCTDTGGIVALPDYYIVINDDNGIASSYECLPKACLAGDRCAANASMIPIVNGYGTYIQSCCAANRVNSPDNILCGACLNGYSMWGNECVYCDKPNVGMIFALALVMWSYLLVFHRLAQSTAPETRILLNYGQMVLLIFGPGMHCFVATHSFCLPSRLISMYMIHD
jgi:hypothetical protein